MGDKSNKSLWSLISGSAIQTDPNVLENELSGYKTTLSKGLLSYPAATGASCKEFTARKDVSASWKEFVGRLVKIFDVEENTCYQIVCSYLSSEFRGTLNSLSTLIKDDQKRKPLILDIWQFYRAERLYLLQIIKQILSHKHVAQGELATTMATVLKSLDSGQPLLTSLLNQLKTVIKERAPEVEVLGPTLAQSCRNSWIHFNLREVSELLQLILITLHVKGFKYENIQTVTDILYSFGFGTKLPFRNEVEDTGSTLVQSISLLSISILVHMLDLPSLSSDVEGHRIWGSIERVSNVERLVSGLGNHPHHSPALLAWTLSTYLARGPDSLGKSSRMGETALANRVLHTLKLVLEADFNSHNLVSDIIHLEVYSLVSVLLSAFDPVSLGLTVDVEALARLLLKHRSVAAHFWKQGSESGLAFWFNEVLTIFPLQFSAVIECMSSLASASETSCQNVVTSLTSLNTFTEKVDTIQSRIGRSIDGSIQTLEDRYPFPSTKTVSIPANTKGELLDNGSVVWNITYNGWQVIFAECGELNMEISKGEEQVTHQTLTRVTKLAALIAEIISTCPDYASKLGEIVEQLGGICQRFCQVSHPPLNLLAAITNIYANIATTQSTKVLKRLKSTGLLPQFSYSHSLMEKTSATLAPGLIGYLLAGEETVSGEYPLLTAFLQLLKESVGHEECEASILFVCREVLPNLNNWRYSTPGDRERILKLSLAALLKYLDTQPKGGEVLAKEHSLCGSLLELAATGDRTVQALLENQVSWESGRGTDFCEIVKLSLQIINSLLSCKSSGAVLAGPVGYALRAPPSASRPHLLLSLAHYSYFFHDPSLATAAISLLAAIASAVDKAQESVSMLACLGNSAGSVKELLLERLQSPLEDIRLKIGIVKLVSECAVSQPGMLQLLLDINTNISVAEGGQSQEVPKKDGGPKLVGDGCLDPVLHLLKQSKDKPEENWQELELSIVKMIYNLWDTNSLLATQYLKEEPEFWNNLCRPIFDYSKSSDQRHTQVKAYVLRILASEIYTWKGKVSTSLTKILERIFNEKSDCMENWCEGVALDKLQDDTMTEKDDDVDNYEMFLISSWRIFLLVISKETPSTVSPAACRVTFQATVRKLKEVIDVQPPPLQLTLLLAETGTVLLKRWQTKCTDNMEVLCNSISGLLEIVRCVWSNLHQRTQLALLALSLSTLKVSQCKLEQESKVLLVWVRPVLQILSLAFVQLESCIVRAQPTASSLQSVELTLALLQTLISRFSQERGWLAEVHSEASLQLLVTAAGSCCRHKAAPSLVSRILELLVEVAGSNSGATALLNHPLDQQIWLPLSDLPATEEWSEPVLHGLELCSTLLRTSRTHALNTVITAVAILVDKLVAVLIRPRNDLTGLKSAASVGRLVSLLSGHISTWRSQHPESLLAIFRYCSSLLQYSAALLMRPTLLASMVKVSGGMGTEEDQNRCRRVSSCSEVEVELVPPEAEPAHSLLLDISISALTLLQSLSPSLPSLLTGDALLDPDRWEPLLLISFSNPGLEEGPGNGLSYGTLIALANTCVRSLTREHARSPSPARSGLTRIHKPSTDTPEKRRLLLAMERSLVFIICQFILTVNTPGLSPRDIQLLRRELGAELGSITDTMRRHYSRGGGGGKSPGPSRSARSPQPPASPQPTSSGSTAVSTNIGNKKSEDQFIKFFANLIGNVLK